MGFAAEQTVAVIEAVNDKPNYWWLLIIGVIPVAIGFLLTHIFGNKK